MKTGNTFRYVQISTEAGIRVAALLQFCSGMKEAQIAIPTNTRQSLKRRVRGSGGYQNFVAECESNVHQCASMCFKHGIGRKGPFHLR